MDSLYGADPSLPRDLLDGSTNPDLLGEVTFGTHLQYPDGSVPMVEKTSSGRMSPVRARTMKEYDHQIADLKKENFSLKLRIYFLEERIQTKYGDDEDVFKTNIELKVEMESMRKELYDKQELLKSASTAMESLISQHQEQLERVTSEADINMKRTITELDNKLKAAEKEAKTAKAALQDLEIANIGMPAQDEVKTALAEKNKIIEQMRFTLKTKDTLIEQLEEEKVEAVNKAREPLEQKIKSLQRNLQRQEQDIESYKEQLQQERNAKFKDELVDQDQEDIVQEQQRKIDELEIVADQLNQDMQNKDDIIGQLEDGLRSKDKEIKDLENQLEQLDKKLGQKDEAMAKGTKGIQGLTKTLQAKQVEIESLKEALKEAEEKMHDMTMKKYQGLEDQQLVLSDKETRISELEGQLRIKDMENQKLQRALKKKDTEADSAIKNAKDFEEEVEKLEKALQDLQAEKQRAMDKLEDQEQRSQSLLEDAQRQLQNKDKVIQSLTKSLHDKDSQLQDYIDRDTAEQPYSESKDNLITKLRDRLKERDKAVEDAIEDKFRALEERDNEIRGIKMTLRERERDVERANQMLLNTEETIDTMERECREKDQNMRQLANSLKAQQRTMEELADNHQRALQEKEDMIAKLQRSLASEERKLQSAVTESPSSKNAVVQQLQERLREKDAFLEEVMSERSKVALANEDAIKQLLDKLRGKDVELRELSEAHSKELSALNKEMQKVQTDLNKKEYELQSLENRATWTEEQQQEMLDNLRTHLNEKDKTIEALVESGRQKDRLLSQFREPEPLASSPTHLAELHKLKDEVMKLKNDIQNKDDLIERLRAARERSPKHSVIYDTNDLQQELDEMNMKHQQAVEAEQRVRDEFNQLREHYLRVGVDPTELQRLRVEVVQLREQVERPGTPQRLQTTVGGEKGLNQVLADQVEETKRLNQALQAERTVYSSLNSPHRGTPDATDLELNSIHSLRRQLEEGIERNNHMRGQLVKQLEAAKNRATLLQEGSPEHVSSLQNEIRSLENQLEESKRWNVSLQSRLEQQQQRGGGVGRAKENEKSRRQESSSWSDTPGTGLSDSSRSDSPRDLQELSPSQLREQVSQLKAKLKDSKRQKRQLQQQLQACTEGRTHIPGENIKDKPSTAIDSDAGIKTQVRQLQERLRQRGQENMVLRQGLGLSVGEEVDEDTLPDVRKLQDEVERLRGKVGTTENLNKLLKKQIELDTSTEEEPSGFNPDLIIQMAQEIERLKAELESTREKLHDGSAAGKTKAKPPPGHKSQIPTLKSSSTSSLQGSANTALRQQLEAMRAQLQERKSNVKALENKLASTEATVRSQTEKMKYYRGMLVDAGLMSRTPQRSSSDSNLAGMRTPKGFHLGSASTENLLRSVSPTREGVLSPAASGSGSSLRGLNLAQFDEFGQTSNIPELKDQIKLLREQLERYQRIIRSLQARARLASDSSEKVTTPPRGQPPRGVDHVTAGNQEAFGKLNKQVEALKKQLKESHDLNATLKDQLNATLLNATVGPESEQIKTLKTTNTALRKKLADSHNRCEALEQQLLEMKDMLQELLHQNEDGEVDVIDVTPERVDELKKKMLNAVHLAAQTVGELDELSDEDADDEPTSHQDTQAGPGLGKSKIPVRSGSLTDIGTNTLQERYQQVQAENETLKQQLLEERRKESPTPLKNEIAVLEEENQQLKSLLEQNQQQAEGTSQDLIRLSMEIEEKNNTIKRLRQKVKHVQQKYGRGTGDDRSRSLSDSPMSDESFDSERKVGSNHRRSQPSLSRVDQERLNIDGTESGSSSRHSSRQSKDTRQHRDLPRQTSDATDDSERTRSGIASEHRERRRAKLRRSKEGRLDIQSESDVSEEPSPPGGFKRDHQLESRFRKSGRLPDDSFEPIERARHRTASGVESHRNYPAHRSVEGSLDYVSEDSTTSSIHEQPSHLQGPTRRPSGREGDGSKHSSSLSSHYGRPLSHVTSTVNYFGSREDVIVDYRDEDDMQHKGIHPTNGQVDTRYKTDREISRFDRDDYLKELDQENTDRLHDIVEDEFSTQSEGPHDFEDVRHKRRGQRSHLGQRSSDGDSDGVPRSRDDVLLTLKSQLRSAEDLNETLREELRLYEDIAKLNGIPGKTSQGIQSSPGMSSHSSQTGSNAQSVLDQYLNEIRALRLKLEESVNQNNKLRQQLEDKLASLGGGADSGAVTNIYLQQTEAEIRELQQQLASRESTNQELKRLQEQSKRVIDDLKRRNQDLEKKNGELNKKYSDLMRSYEKWGKDKQDLEKKLRMGGEENKRLNDEVNRLQQTVSRLEDQLAETQGLNKTFKMELNMYEKMKQDSGDRDASSMKLRDPTSGLDLTQFFEEMRHLRIQLERTIENNNALRQKLEENLSRGFEQRPQSSTVNIHHVYSRQRDDRASGSREDAAIHPESAGVVGDRGNRYYTDQLDNHRDQVDTSDRSTGSRQGRRHYSEQLGSSHGSRMEGAIRPEQGSITGDRGNRHYSEQLSSRYSHKSEDSLRQGGGNVTGERQYFEELTNRQNIDGEIRPQRVDLNGDRGNRLYSQHLDRNQENRSAGSDTSMGGNGLDGNQDDKLGRSGNGEQIHPERRELTGDKGNRMYSSELDSMRERHRTTDGVQQPNTGLLTAADLQYPSAGTHRRYRTMSRSMDTLDRSGLGGARMDTFRTYHVDDPKGSPGTSPIRVDSDLRVLYAICKIDDFELLRREIQESMVVLSGLEARLRERLRTVRTSASSGSPSSQNIEVSTLKSISMSAAQLRICLNKETQLIGCFWFSQLPTTDANGYFVDTRLLKQNEDLKAEILDYKTKYFTASDSLRACQERLETNNRLKQEMDLWDAYVTRKVTKTNKVLKQARTNFRSRSHSVQGRVPQFHE